MSRPDRPPRHYDLDPEPDVVCPLPPWIAAVVDRARRDNLHPDQRAALRWLLESVQADRLDPPGLVAHGTGPGDLMVLLWASRERSVTVRLRHTAWGHPAVRVVYSVAGERVADEAPRWPGDVLRTRLGLVFPGLVASGTA